MSTAARSTKKSESLSNAARIEEADAKIDAMLDKASNPALVARAKAIVRKILSRNARVYETDKAGPGLAAVSVYLACEEFAPSIGKKLTQKECQQQSDLGPKLFRRTVDMCRSAKDLDTSKINFVSLVRQYGGNEALGYMDIIYKHFKKSCFDAGIVTQATWDENHILVVCAVYCWVCDRVFPTPAYKGPDVAFHCGLGWENVQKSMYYNLNPHCTEKMRELLEAEKSKRMTHAIKATSVPSPSPKLPTPIIPSPTPIPSFSVTKPPPGINLNMYPSSMRMLPSPYTLPSHSSSGFKPSTPGAGPTPMPPLTMNPYTSMSMSLPRYSLSNGPPSIHPTPIPQGPYAGPPGVSGGNHVPGYAVMDRPDITAKKSGQTKGDPKRRESTGMGRGTPMEIDLTGVSDDDDVIMTTVAPTSKPAKRKSASSSVVKKEKEDGNERDLISGSTTSKTPKSRHGSRSRSKSRLSEREALSDIAWTNRTDEELFFKPDDDSGVGAGETKVEMELRVYYAWKRIIERGNDEKGPVFGDGDVRDFVIT